MESHGRGRCEETYREKKCSQRFLHRLTDEQADLFLSFFFWCFTSAVSQFSMKNTCPSNNLMLARKFGLSSMASSNVMFATGIMAATPSVAVGPGDTEGGFGGTVGMARSWRVDGRGAVEQSEWRELKGQKAQESNGRRAGGEGRGVEREWAAAVNNGAAEASG